MAITPTLQRQHEEIQRLDLELTIELNKIQNNCEVDRKQITRLANKYIGKLLVHIAMEDNTVYSESLLAPDDSQLCRIASEMSDTMDLVRQKVLKYREEILIRETIDIKQFASETLKVLEIVRYRIEREENDLYPLYLEYREQNKAKGKEVLELI